MMSLLSQSAMAADGGSTGENKYNKMRWQQQQEQDHPPQHTSEWLQQEQPPLNKRPQEQQQQQDQPPQHTTSEWLQQEQLLPQPQQESEEQQPPPIIWLGEDEDLYVSFNYSFSVYKLYLHHHRHQQELKRLKRHGGGQWWHGHRQSEWNLLKHLQVNEGWQHGQVAWRQEGPWRQEGQWCQEGQWGQRWQDGNGIAARGYTSEQRVDLTRPTASLETIGHHQLDVRFDPFQDLTYAVQVSAEAQQLSAEYFGLTQTRRASKPRQVAKKREREQECTWLTTRWLQQRKKEIKEHLGIDFPDEYVRKCASMTMKELVDMYTTCKEEAKQIMEQEDNKEDKERRHREAMKKIQEQEEKDMARIAAKKRAAAEAQECQEFRGVTSSDSLSKWQ